MAHKESTQQKYYTAERQPKEAIRSAQTIQSMLVNVRLNNETSLEKYNGFEFLLTLLTKEI